MRVYRFDKFGSLDGLTLHDEQQPEPQRGEILLKVHAVSLNYRDIAIVTGKYVSAAQVGLVPTSDAAAEIVSVGQGVQDLKPGERVISTFHPRWFGGRMPETVDKDVYGSGSDGWLCQYKVVSQEAVVRLPDSLSYEEGSTIPCAAATAWNALMGPAPIRSGQTVLTMGTGGVSIFALQLAKQLGARVISTTSSAQKSDWLKAKGATATINYKEIPDWAEEVRKDTGQRGVDRVVEVGGPSTINQSLKSVAIGGEIVLIGFLSEQNPGIDYFALKGTKASLRSIAVGDRDNLESVVRAIDQTGLKPVIDSVHQFSEAKKAFELLEQRKHIGKIVIKVSESQMEPV